MEHTKKLRCKLGFHKWFKKRLFGRHNVEKRRSCVFCPKSEVFARAILAGSRWKWWDDTSDITVPEATAKIKECKEQNK